MQSSSQNEIFFLRLLIILRHDKPRSNDHIIVNWIIILSVLTNTQVFQCSLALKKGTENAKQLLICQLNSHCKWFACSLRCKISALSGTNIQTQEHNQLLIYKWLYQGWNKYLLKLECLLKRMNQEHLIKEYWGQISNLKWFFKSFYLRYFTWFSLLTLLLKYCFISMELSIKMNKKVLVTYSF